MIHRTAVRWREIGAGITFGSGIVYSCDPVTGEPGLAGRFQFGVSGARLLASGGQDVSVVAAAHPWGAALTAAVDQARARAGHPVRVEFIVDNEELRVLAVTPAPLRGAALITHVGDAPELDDRGRLALVDERDLADALAPAARVTGLPAVAHGLGVAPGTAGGIAVFSAQEAVTARESGLVPVLILPVTMPQDLPGLLAAAAVVTEHGGSTSHAAVVTRGLGRVCVTALADARIETDPPCLRPFVGTSIHPGDPVTVDGGAGTVHAGLSDTRPAPRPVGLDRAVRRILAAADRQAGLAIRVNADSPADARAAVAGGAAGIGLCRIEHMLLGDRQALLARILTGTATAARREALAELGELLRDDFAAMLRVMPGLPVTIRLLDPPRHEFLPDLTRLETAAAVERSHGRPDPDPIALAAARRLHERNPMLGVRGVRLGVLDPRLLEAQLTALVEAVTLVHRDGGDPHPELLVPMVTLPAELDLVRARLAEAVEQLGAAALPPIPVGAMVETPRAALLAGDLAGTADFLSIGTNDLTALLWGISRDDAERELVPAYRDLGLLAGSPTLRWDKDGLGELVRVTVTAARAARPGISIGVCGEQAVEPTAARRLTDLEVNYVSCSPARLPAARLIAGRHTIGAKTAREAQ